MSSVDYTPKLVCMSQQSLVRTFVTEHGFSFQEINDADLSRAFGRQIERLNRYAPRLRPGRVAEFTAGFLPAERRQKSYVSQRK